MRNRGNYLVRKGMKISLGAAAVLALALTAGAQSRSVRHGGGSAGTSNGIGGGASLGVSGGIQGGISGGVSGGVGGGIGWGVEGGISQGLGNLAGLGDGVDLSGAVIPRGTWVACKYREQSGVAGQCGRG